jgi:hypothetical protein
MKVPYFPVFMPVRLEFLVPPHAACDAAVATGVNHGSLPQASGSIVGMDHAGKGLGMPGKDVAFTLRIRLCACVGVKETVRERGFTCGPGGQCVNAV